MGDAWRPGGINRSRCWGWGSDLRGRVEWNGAEIHAERRIRDLFTPMAEDLCQEVEHEWQVDSDQQHQPVVFPQIVEPWLQH